jgi:hypothetical protein
MRKSVLSTGHVPANPESILGYKDTVSYRLAKRGVLLDDLTVLRGCDELWIFTELRPEPNVVPRLAEGVVTELLFYLKRQENPHIYFVSPSDLFREGRCELRSYSGTYQDTKAALHPEQRDGILELANSGGRIDRELRSITYHVHDPLDFKYASWLRSSGYASNQVPLVPGLAIEIGDWAPKRIELGDIVASWACLSRLGTDALVFPSMDSGRSQSAIAALLERLWLLTHSATTISKGNWANYKIPKATVGSRWPLTKWEGGVK